MTSLDMAGCSITLLRLDDELATLWDAPVYDDGPAVGRLSERAVAVASKVAGMSATVARRWPA